MRGFEACHRPHKCKLEKHTCKNIPRTGVGRGVTGLHALDQSRLISARGGDYRSSSRQASGSIHEPEFYGACLPAARSKTFWDWVRDLRISAISGVPKVADFSV